MSRKLVILESPFAGNVARNLRYARACLRDSLLRKECPIASHLLYTQPGVLDDNVPAERTLGIEAGLAWLRVADATVVYEDLGISGGMRLGIDRAKAAGRPVEYRTIGWTDGVDDGINIETWADAFEALGGIVGVEPKILARMVDVARANPDPTAGEKGLRDALYAAAIKRIDKEPTP